LSADNSLSACKRCYIIIARAVASYPVQAMARPLDMIGWASRATGLTYPTSILPWWQT